MENVVLVIHLILALGIILLVLIQRSEGGGLGIGGSSSGGMGGFATPQGTASVLTKMTAFFAACFFITSLTLAILAGTHSNKEGILSTYAVEAESTIEERAQATEEGLTENGSTEEGAASEMEGTEETSTEPEASVEPVPTAPSEKPSVPVGE